MSGGSSSSSGGSSSTPKVKNKSHKGTERDRGDMGLFYKEAERLFNLSSMEETIKEWRKVCKHHEGAQKEMHVCGVHARAERPATREDDGILVFLLFHIWPQT